MPDPDACHNPVLLMQTGDAPEHVQTRAGNYDAMFYQISGLDRERTLRVHVKAGERLPGPEQVGAAVITGSPDMVTDRLPWSEYAAGWLREALAAGLPLLGVCYGHQLMAQAIGGTVDYLKGGLEIGTIPVTLTDAGRVDPLFSELPASFHANLTHSQTVVQAPAGAVVLACSEREPHQAIRYGDKAVSFQFHPEFDGAAMAVYADFYACLRPEKAERFHAVRDAAADTPEAASLLNRFLELS